jgi:hypothetical protein
MSTQLTARTTFQGTCPECGRPAVYTPLPGGFAPRSAFLNITCRDCGAKVRLTATPCTVCHVQAILKNSEFFAARGLDWPLTLTPGPIDWTVQVHKACASEVEATIRHAGDLAIDAAGVGRWTTNNQVIPDDSAALLFALGLARGLDPKATAAACDAETREILAAYRAKLPKPNAEQLAEMRAAFGPGTTVTNIITGTETQL